MMYKRLFKIIVYLFYTLAYAVTDFDSIQLIRKLQIPLQSIKQRAIQLNVATKKFYDQSYYIVKQGSKGYL